MVCVGAVSTDAILHLAEDAQAAGANALLLPAVSYQPPVTKKSFHSLRPLPGTCLYRCVSMIIRALRILPLRMNFTVVSPHLRGSLGQDPGVPDSPAAATERVKALRQHLHPGVTIGISGDAYAGLGLNAGCEVWYSVCGGLFLIWRNKSPKLRRQTIVNALQP